jgi:hypothetical protein
MGAFVIVINSEKVVVTGKKFDDKTYFRHVNGRPGSYSMESFKHLQAVSCKGWWNLTNAHCDQKLQSMTRLKTVEQCEFHNKPCNTSSALLRSILPFLH